MDRIIWCMNVYQSKEMLEKSIPALPRVSSDLLIVVDGAYQKWPHTVPWSTDGTVEYAKEFADIVVEVKRPWRTEWEKRNSYLMGGEGDWYVVVDSDEVWRGPRPDLGSKNLNEDFYNIELRRLRKDGPPHFGITPVFRVYRAYPDLYIYGAHHAIWKGQRLLTKEARPKIPGVMLEHLAEWRSKEYLNSKGEYYRIGQKEDELEFGRKMGLRK